MFKILGHLPWPHIIWSVNVVEGEQDGLAYYLGFVDKADILIVMVTDWSGHCIAV